MDKDFQDNIKGARRDLSDWVWHFTRRDRNPLDTLKEILDSRCIKGSQDPYCKELSICFTEMPLTEAIRQSPVLDALKYERLSDYGVGFSKKWLFGKGGLPVIYQPDDMRENLPADMRWRHCQLDYKRNIDFSWQREWRVKGNQLEFTPEDDSIVVLKTEDEAISIIDASFYVDPKQDEGFHCFEWSYVTHDSLCEGVSPDEIETFVVQ